MIRRMLPLVLLLALCGCAVYPAPGYYGPGPVVRGRVHVAPPPYYYAPRYHRPYGWRRW